jgi:hypothetical protein
MHNRALVLAVFSCSCLLSACSGGGSSPPPSRIVATATPSAAASTAPSASPSPTHAPTATPTATPTPTPTPVPATYPYTAGSTFVYGGTLAQSFQSFPEVVAPGSPSPEPIATTLVDVSQTVTVKSNQTFDGTPNLTDLHLAETDAQASGLESTTSTTDTYEAVPGAGATAQLLDYGSNYADESGDTVSTLLTQPTVVDELPELAGAQWTNGPAATIDEALAGNATGSAITVVRTVNPDGTYSEKTTYPPNYSGIGVTGVGAIQENADGSGTFVIASNGSTLTLTYSPPEPQPSGSPLITVNEYNGTDTTAAPTQTFQIPSWYGPAPALYAESDRDLGVVSVPHACGLGSPLPASATEISQSISRTDTILGYLETETTNAYVAPGYGVVCTTFSDKQTAIYDFNGDEPFVFTGAPPLEITTSSETLALQPSSTIATSVQRRPASLAVALRARFEHGILAARERRIGALMRRAMNHRRAEGAR